MGKPKKLLLLEKILRLMAIAVLKRHRPKIIGITGSVGKTSTKEAVFCVLKDNFRTRKNEKNYNNEIGIPLTIIGSETGGGSIFKWIGVSFCWLWTLIFSWRYPEILILEMGADRPGDIKYLKDFTNPQVGIITDISMSHIEFLKNIEGVAREKSALVKDLPGDGLALLNADNKYTSRIKNQINTPTLMFGFGEKAQLRASEPVFNFNGNGLSDSGIQGLSFKLDYQGTILPVRLNGILAEHQIYAALAAFGVATFLGMNLVDIAEALGNFSSPAGRMTLVRGIKNTYIIDDTYNSSPASAIAALRVLEKIKASRKIVVLGDMLELGGETENGHRKVAQEFLRIGGDIFLAVGSRMKFAVSELEKRGFEKEKIYHFKNSQEAGKKLQQILKEDDLVLVKGSQGARMEKVVEEVMSESEKAPELLVRQEEKWKSVPVTNL